MDIGMNALNFRIKSQRGKNIVQVVRDSQVQITRSGLKPAHSDILGMGVSAKKILGDELW